MSRVAELIAPGRFAVLDRAPAAPETDHVRIAVTACGVCGSDVQRFKGKARQQYPIILGHEFSGVIDAVGPNASRLRVGDPVVVAPLIPCHDCPACRTGEYGLCERYSFIGSRRPGGFASTVVVPERNVLLLPVEIPFPASVLVEPLAIGCHAVMRAQMVMGDSVVVVGGGSIGLSAAVMARAAGAARVTVLDISPDRVAHASRLGLEACLLRAGADPSTLGSVVIEAAGSGAALHTALRAARANGRIACVGTLQGELILPADAWELVLRKQLTLVGVWNSYSDPFPGAAWMAAVKTLTDQASLVAGLITHRFPLDRVQECFEWLLQHPGQYGKVILTPSLS